MTVRQFDAPASSPRRAFTEKRSRHHIARIAWLLARFVCREPVRYEAYEERFGASRHAFRRDLTALRNAGIHRGTERLGTRSDAS